ncbi:MAG: PEP-CTERM sorting domain-containing protein, partial [Candidatus Vecturithrix sp.]|nr:PEP-CTERM sorting domain-containing protein [Candidatus Vecturithrix sp.]
SVTLNPAGGTYADGTVVQLTAHADPGWEFSGWSDDLSGNTNPETLTMDADKIVAAIFTESVTGDVSITKAQKTDDSAWTEDPLSVLWGDTISYSLTMTNTFEDAVDLMIGDALSGLVDYVGGTLSGAIYEGDTLVNLVDVGEAIFSGGWWFSGLDAGQTLVIFFDVVVKDEDIVAAGSWIDNMAWIDVYIDQDKVIDHKWSNTVKSEVVPEPATVFFFGIGLFGIFALLRRRRR